MRKSLVLAMIALLVCGSVAIAGVPDPARSGCRDTGIGASPPCQYRFRADGGLDVLTLTVTLRDAFDTPVAACSTSATMHADTGTGAFCPCADAARQTGFTDGGGVVNFLWSSVGGRGSVTIDVTAHCTGNIGICSTQINFTTPDLDGSCDPAPASSTGVLDLALWAGGISPYAQTSDYTCNGTVDVLDLAIWAGGLGKGC